MEKWLLIPILSMLFLTACFGPTGEQLTTCIHGEGGEITRIYSSEDEILSWEHSQTFGRHEFIETFLPDIYMRDDELLEVFLRYSETASIGMSIYIDALTQDEVVLRIVYDYTVIPESEIKTMWQVDEIEDVTFSGALAFFETLEISCETERLAPAVDTE